MKLSAPKQNTFIAAVAVAALAVVSTEVAIPYVSANAFWVLAAGFVVLAVANLFKGV